MDTIADELAKQLLVYTPFDSSENPCPRLRFGDKGDGGYVLFDINLKETEVFYSYGINDNYSFDLELSKNF